MNESSLKLGGRIGARCRSMTIASGVYGVHTGDAARMRPGMTFEGHTSTSAKANLWSRAPTRVFADVQM